MEPEAFRMTGGLSGQYNPGEKSFLNSPAFDFSDQLEDPAILFDIWWETEWYMDGLALQVSYSNFFLTSFSGVQIEKCGQQLEPMEILSIGTITTTQLLLLEDSYMLGLGG